MAPLLRDAEEIAVCSRGHHWVASWHSPPEAPAGTRDGAAGICVTADGRVVVISTDDRSWDFPAGRPEGDEDWEHTLHREVQEEACAVVTTARLLGFTQGRRVENDQIGLPRVRSVWLAQVALREWDPQFEIRFRKLVPAAQAISSVLPEWEPLWTRAFAEAGLP